MTIANAKPDLLITGPIGTSMVNAASSAWHDYLTVEAKITAAIAYAVSIGAKYCYVPDSFLPYTASLVTFNPAVRMTREGGRSEQIDLIAYGGDWTGATDSGAAITAAVNTAIANTGVINAKPKGLPANSAIYVPTGIFKTAVGIAVTVSANQQGVTLTMVGDALGETLQGGVSGDPGPGWGSQIQYTGTSGDFVLLSCNQNAGNSRIHFYASNLVFVGNADVGGAVSGGGFHAQGVVTTCAVHTHFDHVFWEKAKGDGIWLEGNTNCQWNDVQSNQAGGRGLYISDSSGAAGGTTLAQISRESRLSNVSIYLAGSHGLEIQRSGTVFTGLAVENCTGQAILLDATSGYSTFYGVQIENCVGGSTANININSQGQEFYGVLIRYNAGTDTGIRFNSFGATVSGVRTNSTTNQIDFLFTVGVAQHNRVSEWNSGDNIFDMSHVTDGGWANAVYFGNKLITGGKEIRAVTLAWAASVTGVNTGVADDFLLTATSNIAGTIAAPSPVAAPGAGYTQRIRFVIRNNSGGALTTPIAFATGAGAYKSSAGVSPANGTQITVDFTYDQADNWWAEASRSAAV